MRSPRPPAAEGTWTRDQARHVRVIEYEVPDREGDGKDELIALITTIADFPEAPAAVLARPITRDGSTRPATPQLKTYLRGPGKVLRSAVPGHGASRRSGATC